MVALVELVGLKLFVFILKLEENKRTPDGSQRKTQNTTPRENKTPSPGPQLLQHARTLLFPLPLRDPHVFFVGHLKSAISG
jgi:hypothetical protein